MNGRSRLVLGVVLVIGLSVFAAFLADRAGAGTDDSALRTVEHVSGGAYEPWAQSGGVPGGERNAPLFFGVQACAGLTVLAGCLWYWREGRSGT